MSAEAPVLDTFAGLIASLAGYSCAVPRQAAAREGVRSLEVRWIFPGQLAAAVAGWFGQFPASTESRVDTYLLGPRLRGVSVKIRAGGALEAKLYRGSRESSRWPAAPAGAWRPGRSGLLR